MRVAPGWSVDGDRPVPTAQASATAALAAVPSAFDFCRLYASGSRLFVASLGLVAASTMFAGTAWLDLLCPPDNERRRFMDEVERDSDITINVGFGNITFVRDDAGAYAHAVADLTMKGASPGDREDRIEISLRLGCRPEADSIIDIVEKSRLRLATLLRTAAEHFEAATAEALLFREDP